MLVDEYLKEKYWDRLYEHNKERCTCDLSEGGKGLCLIGQYLEEQITAREYLKVNNDKFFDLKFGTTIRTTLGDLARIVSIEKFNGKIYFILDRNISNDINNINSKSNKIDIYHIEELSNNLKDLVQVGDIANGKEIIRIENGKMWYGFFGDEFIESNVTELLSSKDKKERSIII